MCQKIKSNSEIFLIAGLGNPGKDYRHTRHNIGFMVIDHLSNELKIPVKKVKQKSLIGIGKLDNKEILLVKPQTFMNNSGESIAPLMRYYKVPHQNLMVIHDDLDLPFGIIRIRPTGGTSGQKGMKSIIEKIGSQEFPRIRMGIGRPPGHMDPVDFVLENFSKDQLSILENILEDATNAIKTFIIDGLNKAMNTYNGDKGNL